MILHDGLNPVLEALKDRNLGEAISAMETFLSVHPHQINSDRLHAIHTDFKVMSDYWRQGYKDPQIGLLYDNLLRRMYVLYANIQVNHSVRHSSYLSSLFLKAHGTPRDWSPLAIKESLENDVSEGAMLDLEGLAEDDPKRNDFYKRHYDSMVDLCAYLITRDLWSDGFASAMEDILLSPTVDTIDQQLIVSCITLSSINMFDMAKFRVLVHLYQQSTDEDVRQRALVGWVFSLNYELGKAFYQEEVDLIKQLVEDEQCQQELVQMQKQMIFCLNAEKDNQTIQKEIIPDLLRHQGYEMTPNGLIQKEEDPLQDILNGDEQEKREEQIEAQINRMNDMISQGVDIYYSGFTYLKSYPFFQELTNWFVPFYENHPGIIQARIKFKGSRFMQAVINNSTFCNSDKYSFVMSFLKVLDQLPESVRNVVLKDGIMDNMHVDSTSPTFIRRMYLQDWYRFSKLFRERNEFPNPFETSTRSYLFFASHLFKYTSLETKFNEVTAFLLKKKRDEDAASLINNYSEDHYDYQYFMMCGYLDFLPHRHYAEALKLRPDDERALSGLARTKFASKYYEDSLSLYRQLVAMKPESKSYLLNLAVCLTNLKQYDEAEQHLFRLNYENPDDAIIKRYLAWTLTCDDKYEQAENLYQQLLSEEEVYADDLRRYGYCLWFSGKVGEAIDFFRRYLKESDDKMFIVISNERELLLSKGITEPEMKMMLASV